MYYRSPRPSHEENHLSTGESFGYAPKNRLSAQGQPDGGVRKSASPPRFPPARAPGHRRASGVENRRKPDYRFIRWTTCDIIQTMTDTGDETVSFSSTSVIIGQ